MVIKDRKLKVIHIHTDYKFVSGSNIFDGEIFDNEVIIFQNKESYKGKIQHKTILLKTTNRDLNKAVKICINSDLVVLYDLNNIKYRIALSLPSNIKIAWRFFGYELYGRKKELFLSEKSLTNSSQKKKVYIRSLLKFYHYLKYKENLNYIFDKAVKRINYMLVLSNEEYNFLKDNWNNLPEFIKLPHRYFEETLRIPTAKKKEKNRIPNIVIGNNRSSYNNHLDVIELVDNNPAKSNYNFTLLFNYGPTGQYYNAVKNKVQNKPYYTLIDDFIPPDEFDNFYRNISTLVINGYRQMAGANILLAIRNGVKVYLNDKNIFKKWLENEGISVFSITDLDKDLKDGNIQLNYDIAHKNLEQLKKFSERYTKEDFQKVMYNKIVDKSL